MTRLIDADALSELLVKTYEKAPTEKALLFVALLLKNNEQVPTVEPKTTEVVISDDFGHEIKGFYDKGRDMIFTGYGIAPRKWFDAKYTIMEVKKE